MLKLTFVMAGLVPAIHVLLCCAEDVDARHKAGHDGGVVARSQGRPMNNGLDDVVAADTVLSHVDGNVGTIWVRGHTIDDLVANHGFEGTVAIIWEGFVRQGLTRAGIRRDFGLARARAFADPALGLGAPANRPMLALARRARWA